MFGLKPYSTSVVDRLSARQFASVRIVREAGLRGRILDVGCGPGWFEYLMRDDGLDLFGVEPSSSALDVAKVSAPIAHFSSGSALELGYADASFDGAVMFEVIEHVPRGTEAKALGEVRRVLRAGAPFVLSTPYADLRSMMFDPAWYLGHRHYRRERLKRLFYDAGFDVSQTFVFGGTWEVSTMALFYLCKWLLRSEIPWQDVIEKRRAKEFDSAAKGFSNIFVVARAR